VVVQEKAPPKLGKKRCKRTRGNQEFILEGLFCREGDTTVPGRVKSKAHLFPSRSKRKLPKLASVERTKGNGGDRR